MNQDSHVKLFEKIIFEIELKRSGFTKRLRYFDYDYDIQHSLKRPINYRLLEYLKNDRVNFERRRKRIS